MIELQDDDEVRVLGGSKWHGTKDNTEKKHRRLRISIVVAAVILICAGIAGYLKYIDHRMYGFDYPVTREQKDVIETLKHKTVSGKPGINYIEADYLGVELMMYKINGLKAELRDSFPSVEDSTVYLVTRSSDYRLEENNKKIIGDYIRDGKLLSKSNWRAGYFAVLDGNVEIGVGRRPEMRSFLLDNKGSMFRQFALVSAGVKCVSQYILKGKVTRCAYVRTINNDMYYVESAGPETLYGFSDALIEMGAADAIYITGGTQPCLFYRDSNGVAHGTYEDDKAHQMVVWTK